MQGVRKGNSGEIADQRNRKRYPSERLCRRRGVSRGEGAHPPASGQGTARRLVGVSGRSSDLRGKGTEQRKENEGGASERNPLGRRSMVSVGKDQTYLYPFQNDPSCLFRPD